MQDTHSFSVIIPAYNEARQIGRCLESVIANQRQTLTLDLIVVDNGSTDGTVAMARKRGVRVLESPRSIAALRNLGAKETQGQILAFLDADMVTPTDWLEKASLHFGNGFEGILAFPTTSPPEAGWVGRIWGNDRRKPCQITHVDYLSGHNLLINRSVFDRIGGFNENLRTAEDRDLVLRVRQAGYDAILVSEAVLIHLGYEKNLVEFLKKEYWRQHSTLKLARQHGFSPRTLRNPLLSAAHLVFLALAIVSLLTHSTTILDIALACWLLPATAITLKKWRTVRLRDTPGLFLLTWLRWNTAGFALLSQLLHGQPFKEE